MKSLKIAGVIALAVAVLALLWLDVTLAFQFGGWVDTTFNANPEGTFGGGAMLGSFAFLALVVVESVAGYWIYLLSTEQDW